MRLLVANWSRRGAGGAETYLGRTLGALASRGVEVALLHEADEPHDLPEFPVPPAMPRWCLADVGWREALDAARAWKPDVAWTHWITNVALEEAVLSLAPTVLFAHDYRGTCVGGAKTTWCPRPSPCRRRFGPACLLRYFPRRCGGLSPVTMVRRYRDAVRRLASARRSRAVTVLSEHMRAEYARHGIDAARIVRLPPLPPAVAACASAAPPAAVAIGPAPARLLFLGRMTAEKGGPLLLDALPAVRQSLRRPLVVTFAGDGPERRRWEARAARVRQRDQALDIRFVGWVAAPDRCRLVLDHDVLVVPSVWPEPFGLVGLEAAACGRPAVAFAVGGVAEWLEDGVTGCLAPGDRPTSAGLAHALACCLASAGRAEAMGRQAAARAARVSLAAHLDVLENVFAAARDGGRSRLPA
jgi:glycosyltransferase involved in cell wall biosynthesis